MTAQMRVALMRSLIQAFIQFGGVFFSTYIATDDLRAGLLGGGLAAFVAVGFRGVAEGQYDQTRDAAGLVQNSDVTPNPTQPPQRSLDVMDPAGW